MRHVSQWRVKLGSLQTYLEASGQGLHWKRVHRWMCKHIVRFQASEVFDALSPDRKLDSLLLSHLVSQYLQPVDDDSALRRQVTINSILDLQPVVSNLPLVPICPLSGGKDHSREELLNLYRRFGRNNFVIHSYLHSIGHGVFPAASRFFNHSCCPNAVASYTFDSSGVKLEIKAIREIPEGEEVSMCHCSLSIAK